MSRSVSRGNDEAIGPAEQIQQTNLNRDMILARESSVQIGDDPSQGWHTIRSIHRPNPGPAGPRPATQADDPSQLPALSREFNQTQSRMLS